MLIIYAWVAKAPERIGLLFSSIFYSKSERETPQVI